MARGYFGGVKCNWFADGFLFGGIQLDIQIPDPHVRVVGEGGEEEEHAGHGTGEGGNDAREEEAQADGGTERNSGAN